MSNAAEPSMEEILASIRRIISEDGETKEVTAEPEPAPPVARPAPVLAVAPAPPAEAEVDAFDELVLDDDEPQVLELTDPLEREPRASAPAPAPASERPVDDSLISREAATVASQSISSLTGLMVRGYPGSENTLEGLVREILRPLLKDWLDHNLPEMVERMVASEIARITGRSMK